jgi:hypothetical protein
MKMSRVAMPATTIIAPNMSIIAPVIPMRPGCKIYWRYKPNIPAISRRTPRITVQLEGTQVTAKGEAFNEASRHPPVAIKPPRKSRMLFRRTDAWESACRDQCINEERRRTDQEKKCRGNIADSPMYIKRFIYYPAIKLLLHYITSKVIAVKKLY